MSTTAENLRKALALFGTDGKNWVRYTMETALGGCYCSLGALNVVRYGDAEGKKTAIRIPNATGHFLDGYTLTPEVEALASAAHEQLDEEALAHYDWDDLPHAVAEFNDNLESFAEVRSWWTRAIEIAEAAQAVTSE